MPTITQFQLLICHLWFNLCDDFNILSMCQTKWLSSIAVHIPMSSFMKTKESWWQKNHEETVMTRATPKEWRRMELVFLNCNVIMLYRLLQGYCKDSIPPLNRKKTKKTYMKIVRLVVTQPQKIAWIVPCFIQ